MLNKERLDRLVAHLSGYGEFARTRTPCAVARRDHQYNRQARYWQEQRLAKLYYMVVDGLCTARVTETPGREIAANHSTPYSRSGRIPETFLGYYAPRIEPRLPWPCRTSMGISGPACAMRRFISMSGCEIKRLLRAHRVKDVTERRRPKPGIRHIPYGRRASST